MRILHEEKKRRQPYRMAMIAAFNKFLRIYHSRVSEVLNEYDCFKYVLKPLDKSEEIRS